MSTALSSFLTDEGTFRRITVLESNLVKLIDTELSTTLYQKISFSFESYFCDDDERIEWQFDIDLDLNAPSVQQAYPQVSDPSELLDHLLSRIIGPRCYLIDHYPAHNLDFRLVFAVPTH